MKNCSGWRDAAALSADGQGGAQVLSRQVQLSAGVRRTTPCATWQNSTGTGSTSRSSLWPDPIRNTVELRQRTPIALAANEGLWRVHNVYEVIRKRAGDVLCFSSPWVGTLANFHRLSCLARLEGLKAAGTRTASWASWLPPITTSA